MSKDKTTKYNKYSMARLRSLIMCNSFKAGIVKHVNKGSKKDNVKIVSSYLAQNRISSKPLMQLNKSELLTAFRTLVDKNDENPKRALLQSFSFNYSTL